MKLPKQVQPSRLERRGCGTSSVGNVRHPIVVGGSHSRSGSVVGPIGGSPATNYGGGCGGGGCGTEEL